jgi:hypothetical protein
MASQIPRSKFSSASNILSIVITSHIPTSSIGLRPSIFQVTMAASLLASCSNFMSYPDNLIRYSEYDSELLTSYRSRLTEKESILFENAESLKIPVRDIVDNGTVWKKNIIDSAVLESWLGDTTQRHVNVATVPTQMPTVTKDPLCRFV